MLGRGATLLGSNALSSVLAQDAKDVQVLHRCLAAGISLVCTVALPGNRVGYGIVA